MKLLINGKYEDVGLWSFMKCNFIVELTLLAIFYGVLLLIYLIALLF